MTHEKGTKFQKEVCTVSEIQQSADGTVKGSPSKPLCWHLPVVNQLLGAVGIAVVNDNADTRVKPWQLDHQRDVPSWILQDRARGSRIVPPEATMAANLFVGSVKGELGVKEHGMGVEDCHEQEVDYNAHPYDRG